MNRMGFRPGTQLWLKGRNYVVEKRLAQGELLLRETVTENSSQIKETTLIQLWFQGELVFESAATERITTTAKKDYFLADFTQIPEELRSEAKRKYRYVAEVLQLHLPTRTQSSLQPVIEQIAKEIDDSNPPNWLTLYRWLKTYDSSGGDIRSLVPRYKARGDYRPKLPQEVIQIIDRAIKDVYLTPNRPDIADVYDEVLRQITHENQLRTAMGQKSLKIPHRSSIYRAVSNLEPSEKAEKRYGKRIAGLMYDPVKQGPRPTRPLERVEIDHTLLPMFVVDTDNRMPIGTPWLTSAVDKYSGITLGYYASFEPPSYLSVMQCLSHAIRPKNYLRSQYQEVENTWDTYGLPEVIVTDNGKEFYSTHFEDACLSLGIVIQYTPPKMPWYKSSIERYFGTLNTQLLSNKPGKSFSSLMERYDYDPCKNAVISFAALQEMLHIFIVDIHNQSSHPEYFSPRAEVWNLGISEFPPALPPSHQELSVLIGALIERKITRKGVEFEGLVYNSSELARLRSEAKTSSKTKVKYDPTDLSQIYVFDEEQCQFIEVPAINQEYSDGLTLWQHKVIKQLARVEANKVDIVALALAKEKIQRIVEREWKKSQKGKSRNTMARWLGVGKDEFYQGDFPPPTANQSQEVFLEPLIVPPHSIPYSGISDLGSAYTASADGNPSHGEEPEVIVSNLADNQTPKSPAQKRKSKEKSKKLKVEPVSSSPSPESEWQPDCSGWDVSYGLPQWRSTQDGN